MTALLAETIRSAAARIASNYGVSWSAKSRNKVAVAQLQALQEHITWVIVTVVARSVGVSMPSSASLALFIVGFDFIVRRDRSRC